MIPYEFGWFHMERAVEDAIQKLNRTDVIGLANVEMEQTVFSVGLYTQACWNVRGVPAVVSSLK